MSPSMASATVSKPTLTISGARVALVAAENQAQKIGVPMNIAVVDAYTHLLAFSRMDGAKITSVNIAMDKAFTAAGHRIPTSSYKEVVWSGGAAYGINHTNGGRFCTIGGGVPIIDREGNVLGAIGCSTGTPTQDEECSNAGKKAVLDLIECERVEAVAAAKRKIASIGADFKHTEAILVEEIVA